jgi:hypothetical protein
MPEIILCRYCKQPINKETDGYVLVRNGTQRYPEELAHVPVSKSDLLPLG